jgi:hypothetical protein
MRDNIGPYKNVLTSDNSLRDYFKQLHFVPLYGLTYTTSPNRVELGCQSVDYYLTTEKKFIVH